MALNASEVRSIVKSWITRIREDGQAELDTYSGKRKEPRFYPWSESLQVRVGGEVIIARGENLSSQGIGIACRRELPRGAIVEMRRDGDRDWIPIRIQHATQTVGGFKIGARFLTD